MKKISYYIIIIILQIVTLTSCTVESLTDDQEFEVRATEGDNNQVKEKPDDE
jgi:type II secretory pathway component PulK